MKNIQDIIAKMEAERAKAGEEADEQRTVLAAAMISAGVKRVHIEFAGYGDSGQIDNVDIEMHPGREEPDDLEDQLIEWAYKFLEGTGVDWVNNDGGQGEITFDLTTAPAKFSAYVDYNETVAHRVFEVEEGA